MIANTTANAAEHVIQMLNKNEAGQTMVFEPMFVKAEPGDTIKFVPTDKNHNSESVKEIWPEGVPPVKGAYSTVVEFKAEKDGLYLFKCLPHYGMGMIALVQVGKPTNLEQMTAFKAMGLSSRRLLEVLPKVVP
ncbi:MAG TPA: pseudoazurin [Hyphomicrobium sp.]|nr:pseudoazurin [Hyphomicrobium sp.]